MTNIILNAARICAVALGLGTTQLGGQAVQGRGTLNPAQLQAWREDLAYIAREMARRHRNLYHTVTRAGFHRAVSALHRRIPSLERHEVIVELARLVALVGDGHTNIAPTRDSVIGFRTLPVRLYFFEDGLFVRAAEHGHGPIAGARVLRIGRATPEEAYQRVRELIGRDNEMGARFFAPALLAMPEVLHALGLIADMEKAPFELEQQGRRSTVILRPVGLAPMMPPDTDVSWWPDSGWVDMRRSQAPIPLWLKQDSRNHFWFEYLPESSLVYVQLNKIGDEENETLKAFSGRLLAFLDTVPVSRLALDLRLNRGGDGTLNPPLVRTLIKARTLDRPGSLFVLIGRGTFSAAQFLVNELENFTDAIFVGEPTGGKVNSYGDSRKIFLPHSGITVRVSTLWWQEDPRDTRTWKAPDIAAELTASQYRNGTDPALEAVLEYRPQPSVTEQMSRALDAGDLKEATRRYRAYRADPRYRYAETEQELNAYGYRLLEQKRFEHAILVLELNAAEYPQSANVYDSLGEAYLLAGRSEPAIRNYRKSLRLDPSNQNARAMLEKLGQ